MLVSSDIFRGGEQDGGCSGDSGGPKQPEQLQRAGVSPLPELSKDELAQSVLAAFRPFFKNIYDMMITLRHRGVIFFFFNLHYKI